MIKSAQRICDYALANYRKMLREPDGLLKYQFLVPGSVYENSLWDWDSWLANIALRQFVTDDISAYEKGSILNFLEVMDENGRTPIVIIPQLMHPDVHNTKESNIHKPCLVQHAAFLVKCDNGDAAWLRPHFAKLKLFVDQYIQNFRHENGLYYWYDDAAVGVDNDPCTFYRPNKSSASIYLNCLMYKELLALCYIGACLDEDVTTYQAEADHLKTAVQTYCYDEKDGFYYSVDLNLLPIDPNGKHVGCPRHWDCLIQRIGVWSGFMAMWSGIATPEQAKRMVEENLLDEKGFWAPFGVRTLSKYEKMYRIVASGNPSCWLGPIWGISNYMVFRGLVKYGFDDVARELANKTISMFTADIDKTGVLHEYYDPESGEPVINPNFQNWNLLSINMGAWLDGEEIVEEF